MAAIVDTLRNPDKSLFNGTVKIVPVDAPTFNGGGELYDSNPKTVAISNGAINQVLEPGRYRFYIGESRPLLIQVPNDLANYALADITTTGTPDVSAYVPSDSMVLARDMRFSMSTIQSGEILSIPSRRQHLIFSELVIEPGGELYIYPGGESVIL